MKKKSTYSVGQVIATCAALLLAALIFFPMVWMFFSGFKESTQVHAAPFRLLPEVWITDNYQFLATNGRLDLFKACYWTLWAASLGTTLSLLLNTAAAYAIARMEFYGKKLIFACFVVQMFVPGMTTTMTSFLLASELNMLKTFWVLVIPGIASGGSVFFFRQFFLNLPNSLEEAALIDGCGRIGIYARVFIPLSKAPLVINLAGGFIGYWNAYLWPTLTVANSEYMQVAQVIKSFPLYFSNQDGVVMAASTIALIPPMIMFLIFQKHIVRGFVLSGLK